MDNLGGWRRDAMASARTALVVGVVLTAINHWAVIRYGPYGWHLVRTYALNCLVPFSVSLYSRRSATRPADSVTGSSHSD